MLPHSPPAACRLVRTSRRAFDYTSLDQDADGSQDCTSDIINIFAAGRTLRALRLVKVAGLPAPPAHEPAMSLHAPAAPQAPLGRG